jgi:hypothetical protein
MSLFSFLSLRVMLLFAVGLAAGVAVFFLYQSAKAAIQHSKQLRRWRDHGAEFMADWLSGGILRRFGWAPAGLLPLAASQELRELLGRAHLLRQEIEQAARPLDAASRADLRRQSRATAQNVLVSAWRLQRIQHLQQAIPASAEPQQALQEMQRLLYSEIRRAVDTLQAVPVSLLQLEMQQDHAALARLRQSLQEINQRLRDLTAARGQVWGK